MAIFAFIGLGFAAAMVIEVFFPGSLDKVIDLAKGLIAKVKG